MYLNIHLGHNADYTITYELFDNRVAQRIGNLFENFDQEFVSRTEFHNLGETEEDIQNKIQESIDQIKALEPGVFTDADDLNTLHVNFPEMMKTAEGEIRHHLSMFNYYLHHLEDFQRGKIDNPWFLLAAKNDDGEPLQDQDYDLFEPSVLQNHLYMNYPHIGKHVLELYQDRDINVPADHIVPTSILKRTLLCWFGKDSDMEKSERLKKRVRRFCLGIAHKLPYPVDDKRLAIGNICLGKAIHQPDLNLIAQYRYVHSVTVNK